MKYYDIGEAFKKIEEELMASMIRNLKHHRAEEIEEGFEWSQWQVEQLSALEEYRRRNKKQFSDQFQEINDSIDTLIQLARQQGGMDQEIKILNAIKRGYRPSNTKASAEIMGEFFKVNDRKLNALVEATQNDFKKAEVAMLRMANDKYRKIIYNAHVYANAGGTTYEQAVDMATNDFLRAGINCIEYKNGSRHTMSDYADMCIRTATKRAYLTGEGEKRMEWGESLVIVNKRNAACPKCMRFCGVVLIDDVWSGGKPDGRHQLMSHAIEKGLYHPRCKDIHTTYFPGISTMPDKLSNEEKEKIVDDYNQEQKQNYYERQAEQQERLAKYSLDAENKKIHSSRAGDWENKISDNVNNGQIVADRYTFKEASTIEEAQEYAKQFCNDGFMAKTFKGNIEYKGISIDNANAINKALTNVYNTISLDKISGIKVVSPTSAIGKKAFKDGADAVFAYSPIEHGIFVNKDILRNKNAFVEYVKKSDDAWNLVMKNIDNLSGSQKELALLYKQAGRSLVDGDTVEGLLTHELGHHAQWTLLDTKTNNSVGSRMSEYAHKISGYANASKSEYLAESFSSYIRGERNILDPEYVRYMDSKRIKEPLENTVKSSTIKLRINLFDKQDQLYLDAFSVDEIPGFSDICMHGSPTSVQNMINGKIENMNAKEFAEFLRTSTNYNGEDIRLASCATGKGDNSFAQQLSKELGVRVMAPDDDLYYLPNEGTMFVGSPYTNTGTWRIFNNGVEE